MKLIAKYNQRGQAMSEYVILLVIVAMACAFLWRTLPDAVRAYMAAFFLLYF